MMEGGGGRSLLRLMGVWYPGTLTGDIRPTSERLYRPTLSCRGGSPGCFSGDCCCCQESRDRPEPEPDREEAVAVAEFVAKSSGVGVLSPCLRTLSLLAASPLDCRAISLSWMAVSFFESMSSAASTLELLQATRAATAAFYKERESGWLVWVMEVLGRFLSASLHS